MAPRQASGRSRRDARRAVGRGRIEGGLDLLGGDAVAAIFCKFHSIHLNRLIDSISRAAIGPASRVGCVEPSMTHRSFGGRRTLAMAREMVRLPGLDAPYQLPILSLLRGSPCDEQVRAAALGSTAHDHRRGGLRHNHRAGRPASGRRRREDVVARQGRDWHLDSGRNPGEGRGPTSRQGTTAVPHGQALGVHPSRS